MIVYYVYIWLLKLNKNCYFNNVVQLLSLNFFLKYFSKVLYYFFDSSQK